MPVLDDERFDDRGVGGVGGVGGGGGGGYFLPPPKLYETATLQLLIGEGQIEGLVDGLKSVYLDGTPILNSDGSKNFKGIALALVSGTNTQPAVKGIGGVESEVSVNVQVPKASPVTRSITSNPSAIRVRIALPALKLIGTDGSSKGHSVTIKIERQNASYNSGAWEEVSLEDAGVISGGPFSSKFTRSFRVDLPASGTWQVRVTRVSNDDADAYHLSQTWWEAYTEIIDARLRYPNSAVLSLRVNANQFRSIPKVSLDLKLSRIQVPANYNPLTRAYATTGTGTTGGAWDGTFKEAWSDNPAWVFYDAATKTRYGAGSFLDASALDKWTLYSIGQWCDTMVADGKGGTEPRLACNLYMQNQQNAIKALGQLASIFWGVIYYASGLVVPVADADTAPVAVFNSSNVIDGKFTYEGTARSARHTAAVVKFTNPDLGWEPDTAVYEDAEGIARFGYNPLDLTALGCTSHGQALRLAKWSILTELLADETISFASGLEGSTIKPGDVFQVHDQFRAGNVRFGGRVASGATTTAIPLDAPVTFGAGTHYLKIKNATGVLETRTVTTPSGTVSSLTVSSAFSVAPPEGAVWLLQAGSTASLWRCLSIRKGDGITYDITALKHDPTKYVLLGLASGDVIPRSTDPRTSPAPAGLTAGITTRILNDKQVQTLEANWTLDGALGYQAEAALHFGSWQPMAVSGASAVLSNVQPGEWRVRVYGVWPSGLSPATTYQMTVSQPEIIPPWIESALTPSVVADGVTAQFLYTGPTVTCEDWRGVWTLSAAPRTNRLLYSRDYSQWQKSATITSTSIIAPDGTATATALTGSVADSSIQNRTFSRTSGSADDDSIWLKVPSGTLALKLISADSSGAYSTKDITLTTDWKRFDITRVAAATGGNPARLQVGGFSTWGVGVVIHAWEAQVESGTVPTTNIPTTTTTAVTVTDITVSNGLATLSPAPLQGAILRGVSSNAAAIIAAASLDTKITNLERPSLKNLRASLAASVTTAKAKAQAMVPVVSQASLDTAWSTFTANVDPILAATTDTTIVKATWDGWWSAVYSALANLQGAMSAQANTTANSAYAATVAAGSDGVLSRGEKPGVVIDYNAASSDYTTMLARAQNSGLAYADFSAAWETLRDYMVSLSPAYTSTTTDTTINATTWKNAWNGWKSAHTAMLIRIAGAAPSTVDGISTANQNLTTNAAAPVVDGVTQAAGKVVMLAGQTTESQNGIYEVVYTPPVGAAYNAFPSASTNTSSGGSLTSPALAYDVVSGTTPDDTTYADLNSGSNQNNYGEVIYSGFTGTNLTGDITIKIAPTCQVPAGVGSPTVRVQTSTDGGASYGQGTIYSSTLAMQTITVPVSGVTGANLRVKVRAEAAEDWGIDENMDLAFFGILQSSAKIYSVYLAVPVSGSANWSFSRRAEIGNTSMWQTRAGTTYISGAQYLATVAADNGVTLTTQDAPYEAPLGKPGSGSGLLKRDSGGATSWEARRYGFPDYAAGATRALATVYQAATDGWLSLVLVGSYINDVVVYVGSTNNPTNQVFRAGDDINGNTKYASGLIPIPAGTYYKVANGTSGFETTTLKWYPALT